MPQNDRTRTTSGDRKDTRKASGSRKERLRRLYNILDRHGLWNDYNKDMEYYQTHVIQKVLEAIDNLYEDKV